MGDEIENVTKIVFLIHLVIGVIFTTLYWMPAVSLPLFGIVYTSQIGALAMLIGALFLALSVSSAFALTAKEWNEIKLIVVLELVWLVAGIISNIINFTSIGLAGPVALGVLIPLLILFLIVLLKQEDKI